MDENVASGNNPIRTLVRKPIFRIEIRSCIDTDDERILAELEGLRRGHKLGQFLSELVTRYYNGTLAEMDINGVTPTNKLVEGLVENMATMLKKVGDMENELEFYRKLFGKSATDK